MFCICRIILRDSWMGMLAEFIIIGFMVLMVLEWMGKGPSRSRTALAGGQKVVVPKKRKQDGPKAHEMADFNKEWILCLNEENWTQFKSDTVKADSRTVSVLGKTGTGKSFLLQSLFGKGEDAPNVKSDEASADIQSTSLGVAHYTSTLGSKQHIVHLDVEGEDGTATPQDASMLSKMIGSSGATRCVEWVREKMAGEKNEEKRKQIESEYCQKRTNQVKYAVPRLMYLISDLILILGLDPLQSSYYSEKCKILKATSSGNRIAAPALVVVLNKASYSDCMTPGASGPRPKTIEETTQAYLDVHDPSGELKRYFNNICCICLPNRDLKAKPGGYPDEVFKTNLKELRGVLLRFLDSQLALRRKNGTLFSFDVWYQVVEKAIEKYDTCGIEMRKLLEEIQMANLKDSWPLLSTLARQLLEVPFVASKDGPTHDPDERRARYQDSLPSLLGIMAVHFASNQIMAFRDEDAVDASIALETALKFPIEENGTIFTYLRDLAPCCHKYNGGRYTEGGYPIYCQDIRKHDHSAHSSTRLLFGSKPSDSSWQKIWRGFTWFISVIALECGGRTAMWTDKGDADGAVTFTYGSSTLDRVIREAESRFRKRVNWLLHESGRDQWRLRCMALMSKTLEDERCKNAFLGLAYCLGCAQKLSPHQTKAASRCGHKYCTDCNRLLHSLKTDVVVFIEGSIKVTIHPGGCCLNC